MICILCGVNWPATFSVAKLLQSTLERSGFSANIQEALDLDQIGRLVLQNRQDVLLLTVRWMNPDLIEAVQSADDLTVICVETPVTALFSHWMEHTGDNPDAALREVARDVGPLVELLIRKNNNPNLIRFQPDMATDRNKIAQFIAACFQGSDRFSKAMCSPDDPDIAWPDPTVFRSSAAGIAEIDATLTALDAQIQARRPKPIPVPLRLMIQPGFIVLDGPIDLTGSARGLFFGPLIPIPSGVWTVTASMFCQHVTQRPKVSFDAAQLVDGQHDVLGRSEFSLIEDGRMKISFTFVNMAPHHPLEFRLGLTQGTFEGTVELESLQLIPSSDANQDTPESI